MRYISGLLSTKVTIGASNISFEVKEGDFVSLVGESGSGKSTIANMILRFLRPTKGAIYLGRKDIKKINKKQYYKIVQGVFQDPYSSFNTFYKIDHVLKQAYAGSLPYKTYTIYRYLRKYRIKNVLSSVGLDPHETLGRYPHQLSGGQLQRIMIARALLFKPRLLIADEPTSMIDSSSRAGILNLFKDLRTRHYLSIIFITHDIGQAQYLSDHVIVMKKGKIVEQGPTDEIFLSPKERYTQNLLDCVPSIYRKWS